MRLRLRLRFEIFVVRDEEIKGDLLEFLAKWLAA
jgi:hypothetical protein